jgi:predicted dehydrogenase
MAQLRIGLVGYGSWTRGAYVQALQHDGRVAVVSVVAPSRGSRDRATRELGSNVQVFEKLEQLLNGPSLDALMIAVPDTQHESALLQGLDSGLAVFYEPPISDQRDRLQPVMRRLLAADQITFADLELGLIPVVTRAAQLVRENALGSVRTASIRLESNWGPVPDYDLCNFNHMSTWYVDVLNRILSACPRRVLILDGHGTAGRRQSHGIGHLDYGGVTGTVQANISSVGELSLSIEINGDAGDLKADLLSGDLQIRTRDRGDWASESWPAIKPYADWPGMHECVSAFLDAVENNEPGVNNAMRVAHLQLVGLAAEASKDSGTWADVADVASIDAVGTDSTLACSGAH